MKREKKEGWKYSEAFRDYTYIPRPDWNYNWDYDMEEWVLITAEKNREKYDKQIEAFKDQVLDIGFMYGKYPQKCGQKDLNLLNSTIISLQSAIELTGDKTLKETWYHINEGVSYDLNEFNLLILAGASFIAPVYDTAHFFKTSIVDKCNTLEDFIKEVNKRSGVKVREV